MTRSRSTLAGLLAPVGLTLAATAAHAQAPADIVPLPESPSAPGGVMMPRSGCTPGRCTHRTAIGRRRCKRHLQECFLGFPEEFERPPLGALMHASNAAAVNNAAAAWMTFYAYDFEPGGARLNPRGRDKLAAIAARLPATFAPVIVERTGEEPLDISRRSAVLTALNAGTFPVPPERVLIGPARAGGLRGEEAELIHEGALVRVGQGGPPVGIGVAPSSSAAAR